MTTACIIAATCILIAGLFAVIVERTTERDTAREAAERAGRERDAAEVEARIATDLLAQREADARRQAIRAVPAQRDGSEYEWPALAREIEDDDLTALMRATEEK